MDLFVNSINFSACALLAALTTWAVLSPKVHDGIVIKLGLIFIALGSAGLSWLLVDGMDSSDVRPVTRALLLVNAGTLIVIIGWWLRTRGGRVKRRRSTDWVDLDEVALPDQHRGTNHV